MCDPCRSDIAFPVGSSLRDNSRRWNGPSSRVVVNTPTRTIINQDSRTLRSWRAVSRSQYVQRAGSCRTTGTSAATTLRRELRARPEPAGPKTKFDRPARGPPFDDFVRSLKPAGPPGPTLQHPPRVPDPERHFALHARDVEESAVPQRQVHRGGGRCSPTPAATAPARSPTRWWTQHTYGVQMISCCALLSCSWATWAAQRGGHCAARSRGDPGFDDIPTFTTRSRT